MEAACAKAIAVGDPSYRTIKGILAAGTDIEPVPGQTHTGDAGAAAFLHGPSQLFANVIPMPTASRPLNADQAHPSGALGEPGVNASGEQEVA